MDNFLRSQTRPMLQHELVAVLNCLAHTFQRQTKFATTLSMAICRNITKWNLQVAFPTEVAAVRAYLEKGVLAAWSRSSSEGWTPSDLR